MNTQGRLTGKTAIVTGSGRGIGEAIARLFAAEGASVIVSARTQEQVARVVQAIEESGGKAHGVIADLGSSSGVSALVSSAVDNLGSLDILVHNAGVFPYNKLEDMDEDAWQGVIDINLTSAYRLSKACLPHLKESAAARILFTSSVQGNHAAVPGCAHYAASKAGLTGLIKSAALEFARYGITVNGVEPGLVLTAGTEEAIDEERRQKMANSVPLKRWGRPEEIAQAMLFLASNEAAYITGQSLLIDGGATLPIFRA
jgi:3-oxoacyl-[acyl-carrier protein] reductase